MGALCRWKRRHSNEDSGEKGKDLSAWFETIINEFGSEYDSAEPFQMLVADLGYSDYLGRLAIGKIANGSIKQNDELVCIN